MLYLCSFTLFMSALFTTTQAQTCWYPDGETQAPDTPCKNGTYSACCGLQADGSPAYCLSNGLCLTDMVISRGSCTDATWQSEACGQYCQQDNPSGSKVLIPCSGNDWSCDYDCSSSIFTVASGTFELSVAQKLSLGVDNSTTTSLTTPTSVPVPLANTKIATIAVGAGIGLPLGFLLLIAVSLFIRERRKNTRLCAVTEYSPQAGSSDRKAKRARPSDWRNEKIFYESQSQYNSEKRSDGKIRGDSKAWRNHKIHDDKEDVIDSKALPEQPKQSYHGPGNALHVPSSVYELRAMTPVMELDVRPNSRIRY